MMKQIIYPTFFSRILAGIIDLIFISFFLGPISSYLNYNLLVSEFADFFSEMNIDVNDKYQVYQSLRTHEFANFVMDEGYSRSLTLSLISLAVQLFFVGVYMILFMYQIGTTPGKMIIRAKVVDATSLGRPTLLQLVKRFLVSCFCFVGIWYILFSKKRQSMHDKVADTLVVKI